MRISADKIQLLSYFIGISLLGSLLLSLPFCFQPNSQIKYIDALFISVSAVCVTGLSTVSMEVFSDVGFYVIAALIEFGGLGLLTYIALYLTAPKKKLSLVTRSYIKDFFLDDIEHEPKKVIFSIISLTLVIEIIAAVILFFAFRRAGSDNPILQGIFHAISAFCNAGFSTYNDSLAGFTEHYTILLVVMILIVLGGTGFMVLSDIFFARNRRKKGITFHSKAVIVLTLVLIGFGCLFFFLLETNHAYGNLPWYDKIIHALFQSITPRTAGFSIESQHELSAPSKLITLFLMFIGGSPGSIAGGVKTTTFFIVLLYALKGNPERRGLRVAKNTIENSTIDKAFNIVSKSLMIIVVSILFLTISEGEKIRLGVFSLFDIFFEVFSAFNTVGLSMGITSELSVWSKIILIFTMLLGRLGVVAMAVGFLRNRKEYLIDYPSTNIMVG